LSLQGDLTFATAPQAYAAGLGAIAAAPAGPLAIDCSALGDSDSAGLAVLIEWCAIASQRGVALRFSGFPDRLMRLAEMSEVETLLLSER
jgi:phospholipid transport system transporter-binding protein